MQDLLFALLALHVWLYLLHTTTNAKPRLIICHDWRYVWSLCIFICFHSNSIEFGILLLYNLRSSYLYL
jgi:hypothetical protein